MKTTLLFLFFPVLCSAQPLAFPKKIAKELKSMVYLRGGTVTIGLTQFYFPTAKDTALCFARMPKRVTVPSFYVSDHEVTNAEYMEFVQWGKDSVGGNNPSYTFVFENQQLTVASLPAWTDPFTEARFLHQEKNASADLPVSNVSFYQALAYCSWKTERVNRQLAAAGSELKVAFTLPTSNQWEYAAIGESPANIDIVTERVNYPWKNQGLLDDKGRYQANFGEIRDANGVLIKVRMDDGFYESSPVKQFAPSMDGLYDFAGNVAEWTLDSPDVLQLDSARQVNYAEKHGIEVTMTDKEKAAKYAPARIVKGGSYDDPPAYLLNGSTQLYNENTTLPTIGFRVVMVEVR